MRKNLIFIICITGFALFPGLVNSQTIHEAFIGALKQNNCPAMMVYCHTLTELHIPGYSGTYSQNQMEMILKRFFREHPVTSVSIKKEGTNPDQSTYCIGELVAGNKKYRLYLVSGSFDGKQKIHHIQLTLLSE